MLTYTTGEKNTVIIELVPVKLMDGQINIASESVKHANVLDCNIRIILLCLFEVTISWEQGSKWLTVYNIIINIIILFFSILSDKSSRTMSSDNSGGGITL